MSDDFDELLDRLDKSPPKRGVFQKLGVRPGVFIQEIDFSHIVLPLIDKDYPSDPWFAPKSLDRRKKLTDEEYFKRKIEAELLGKKLKKEKHERL